ncbi:unnamed protein product [Didymodactylos carnosus]|uniref:alpha-L-rhamnosidase n=1 Tax=Didymodactylos carnosus TaxID=1234261 RepID=A0A813NZB4_9BILA|nr:unnamed protein product [Didymodactylos carnosus]CAF0805959.1 unnamed protein product [Didymodactylos carnosus]CAF3522209.1 unnamed protein product [Didymodactylos carnosus]CAF3589633.1 unnamed protein product [Didymodactylos carnosus]
MLGIFFGLLCLLGVESLHFAHNTSQPIDVRIEYWLLEQYYDVVIDTHTPIISWNLPTFLNNHHHHQRDIQQVAYQVQLYKRPAHDTTTSILLWDTQPTESSSTTLQYNGPMFGVDSRYELRVRYWSTHGVKSDWFIATFRTAFFHLLNAGDAPQWIGSDIINMNQLRKTFNIDLSSSSAISSASVVISGIGYYELHINGYPVDLSRKLDVGWTTYQQRTLYVSYDVTDFLTGGANAIGVYLGQGWYNQQQWIIGPGARTELSTQYGSPRFIFRLVIYLSDSSIITINSNETWLGREAEHRADNLYMGTIVDYRAARPTFSTATFVDKTSLWINASILSSPVQNGTLSLQRMPPIRAGFDALDIPDLSSTDDITTSIVERYLCGADLAKFNGVLTPIGTDYSNGKIFDLGQNFAGWCRLSGINVPRGYIVQLRHSEYRYSSGINGIPFNGIDTENLESIAATDTFILQGSGNETIEPMFTYHGFRYLLVNGLDNIDSSQVTCYPVHTQTSLIGNFSSSSVVLNQIQHNILWSQLSNTMSLPTDCPQRNERRGWMGDAALSVDEALFNFDLIQFYLNFLTMIQDNQAADGAISDTVPFTVGFAPADPNWGTAYITITWALYEHTGDITILEQYYTSIRAWIDCLTRQYQQTGLAHYFSHWGDWEPAARMTNTSLISSFAYLHDVHRFINISAVLNQTDNVKNYTELYNTLAKEFHNVFYDGTLGGYADNSQAANVLALALPNVVPDPIETFVWEALLNNIKSQNQHFTGGIVSVAQLYPLLSTNGHHDLAVQLASSTTYPSYGHMFNNPIQNATTTWEAWNTLPDQAGSSLNHHMFNSIGSWFYRYLVGLQLSLADHQVHIHPRMTYDETLLTTVSATVKTQKGLVRVAWTRAVNDIEQLSISSPFLRIVKMTVTIPTNLEGIISFDPLLKSGQCHSFYVDHQLLWKRSSLYPRQRLRASSVNDLSLINVVSGVKRLAEDTDSGTMTLRVSSGQYQFHAVWEEKFL